MALQAVCGSAARGHAGYWISDAESPTIYPCRCGRILESQEFRETKVNPLETVGATSNAYNPLLRAGIAIHFVALWRTTPSWWMVLRPMRATCAPVHAKP